MSSDWGDMSLDFSFSYLWCSSESVPGGSFLPTSGVECKGERDGLAIIWKIVFWMIVEQHLAVGKSNCGY